MVYDSVGRTVAQYQGYNNNSSTSWADAASVADDTILAQSEAQYDPASNVLLVTQRQRLHTESDSALGALGDASNTRLYYCTDPNWNVTALVDSSGNAVEHYVYSTYGQVSIFDGSWNVLTSSSNSYLFSSRELDADTGLYYSRARYFHPTLGRFITRDPIAYAAEDMNLYRYVSNNPMNATDPAGTSPEGYSIYPSCYWKDKCKKDEKKGKEHFLDIYMSIGI